MKFSELKGRAVINLTDTKKIGTVDDLVVDFNTHQVVALKVKHGLFSSQLAVPVADVKNIGQDAVTVSIASDEELANLKDVQGSGTLSVASILNNKVVTELGTLVGQVNDVVLDATGLAIGSYEVSAGGLFAKPQEFPAAPQIRYGPQLLTVPDELLTRPAR